MIDDDNAIDKALNPHLQFILEVFGRKPETGEPRLDALPPSQRLIPNAPLNAQERMLINWGDMRFRENKSAEKNSSIKQAGHSDQIPEPSQQPRKKTLKELCDEHGMKEVPADDPIYQTKYMILLRAPLRRPTQKQLKSLETRGLEGPSQKQMIDRNSKKPEERKKWVQWLAFLCVAFRAHQAILLPRVREVLRSAKNDGLNWQDLYEVAKDGQPSRYPDPPDLGLVDPES